MAYAVPIFFILKFISSYYKFVLECLIPLEPFNIINRYETASIFGIAVFEVLTILNYAVSVLSKLWGSGVLTELVQSFFNIIVIV